MVYMVSHVYTHIYETSSMCIYRYTYIWHPMCLYIHEKPYMPYIYTPYTPYHIEKYMMYIYI